jgi:transposase
VSEDDGVSRRGRQSKVPVDERLRVALTVICGELTVSEAARRHGVTNQTVANWRNRFVEAGKAGLENMLPGPSSNGTSSERRLRSENDELKLALAEATVQLRIWQKGAEYAEKVPSKTSKP